MNAIPIKSRGQRAPKFLRWHLLGINRCTASRRTRAAWQIAGFILGGILSAALLWALCLGLMFAGSLVEPFISR